MNNSYDKYLPIGTIVMLKDIKKRFMITGFRILSKNNNNVVYDYCGCTYPEGVINFERLYCLIIIKLRRFILWVLEIRKRFLLRKI